MDANGKKLNKKPEKAKESDIFLKKHVGLIHCENKLTLIQRKICNILLYNALDKINNQDTYEIPLRKLCSLIGYNSNDLDLIKSSIKSLISIVMEWNLLEDRKFLNEDNISEDAITWNASSLLAGASIKGGQLTYSYSPQMKSVLSSLDIYGRINLFVQAKFNSTYSLVLYENCIRFKNIKKTSWFPLDLFRSLMGVPKDKYKSFKEFKRNVINVALNEINTKADIFIEPEYRKSGRTVTGIQFLLSENEGYQPIFKRINKDTPYVDIPKEATAIQEILTSEFKLSEKQINAILIEYSIDYILEKLKYVRTKKNIEHQGAYLVSALRKDYKSGKLSTEESRVVPENSYQREIKQASEIDSLKNKYISYKINTYVEYLQTQAEALQTAIKNSFEEFLRPRTDIETFKHYKNKGLTSVFVRQHFLTFIDENYSQILGEYLSFDDYLISDEIVG